MITCDTLQEDSVQVGWFENIVQAEINFEVAGAFYHTPYDVHYFDA